MEEKAEPILAALKGEYLFIDNELQAGIQPLGLLSILGFKK